MPSPPEVVEEEGDVEAQGHPLCRTQKHQTEEAVDGIFRDHQLRGGVRVRNQWSGARTDPMAQRGNDVGKCQPTMILELKCLFWLALPTLLGGKVDQIGSKEKAGLAVGYRERASERAALARRFLTLTFLRRQQMRSMFFKRSRCREGKGLDKGSQGAETRAPPTAPGVVTRGRQNSLRCLLRQAARRPHGDCRHGGAFTRISMATAQSLEKASPPGGTRAEP